MSAATCSECPRPVGLWRRWVCGPACALVRADRLAATYAARRRQRQTRAAALSRSKRHWQAKAAARERAA